MSKSSFHDYLMSDVFPKIPGITTKKMFGGYGYYKDGLIFAILAEDQLYFKVGDGNRADYEAQGSHPFTYPMKNGKISTLSYWELPADILESPNELEEWIEKSLKEHEKKSKKS